MVCDQLIARWRHVVTLAYPSALLESADQEASFALWGAQPASLDVMREARHRFDPNETVNPGRYLI